MAESTKVRIGPVRFSYATVQKPKAMKEGDTPKYSVRLQFSKKDVALTKKVKRAIDIAVKNGKATFKGRKPTEYPLKDGDAKPGDGSLKGMWYINAKSEDKPGVVKMVNGEPEEIEDMREFYSGCYGFATVNFFAFNKGSVGVGAGLNHLCKTKDGKPLTGKGTAMDDFADLEVEDDDDAGFEAEEDFDLGDFD